MVRVAHIVAVGSRTGKYGGPFDTSVHQAILARRRGFDVRVYAGTFEGDEPAAAGVQSRTVRHVLGRKGFIDVFSFAQLRLVWDAVRSADVVHVSLAREPLPLLAAAMAVVHRRPLLVQPHGMLTSRTSHAHRLVDALVTRPLLRRAHRIVALTDTEQVALAALASSAARRIVVIGNPPMVSPGALTARSAPPARSALFAGRLHARKRAQDFAAAGRLAASRGWDEKYELLGPDEGTLPEVLTAGGARYLGSTDSQGVLDHLRDCGVFVLPSRDEPWGNVLVAALHMGVPVVVTRSAALSRLIEGYGAGVVVADERPEAIAEAVHRLLSPDHYAVASKNALEMATTEIGEERIEQQLADVYASCARAMGDPPQPQVTVAGVHASHGHSMRRYAHLLCEGYKSAGVHVRHLSPRSSLSSRVTHSRAKKFLAYLESLVIFAPALRSVLRDSRAVVHLADHSDAIWLSYIRPRATVLVTCHDLIAVRAARGELPEHRPRWAGRLYQRAVIRGLARADVVLPVSETTATDVRRLVPGVATDVVLNPLDPALDPGDREISGPASNPAYLLVVSSSGWRKQRDRALAIWTQLREVPGHDPLGLVLVGPELTEQEREAVPASIVDTVVIEQQISDQRLATLYEGATGVIQTSRYEGFGWPIIEANAFGVPVIGGSDAAVREIGRFNILIDENEPIVEPEALRAQLEDSDYRARVREQTARYRMPVFAERLGEILRARGGGE